MNSNRKTGYAALLAGAFLAGWYIWNSANAQQFVLRAGVKANDRSSDLVAIRKATKSFVDAFESGNAKAVAAHWTEGGEYIAADGTAIRNRVEIETSYSNLFKAKAKLKVEVEVEKIRFLSKNTAVEEGYMKVHKGTETSSARYSVLHVRENGKWLMAVVREWPIAAASLRDIDWLIGTWASKQGDTEVRTTYQWDKNKKFILARFKINDGAKTVSGTQRIGEDPSIGLLRSWIFGDKGNFGDGIWHRDGRSKWLIEAAGVSEDGGTILATNIIVRTDQDTFTWQSIDRSLDGEDLPDLAPVKISRVK